MRKYRRITCDLDTLDEAEVAYILRIFAEYGFRDKVSVSLSPSGKGYHIIAWNKKGVSKRKLLKIRKIAGDDETRIKLDSMAKRQINVLFDSKKKRMVNNMNDILTED